MPAIPFDSGQLHIWQKLIGLGKCSKGLHKSKCKWGSRQQLSSKSVWAGKRELSVQAWEWAAGQGNRRKISDGGRHLHILVTAPVNYYAHSRGRTDPHLNFYLDVKTGVATHTYRECDEIYLSYDKAFWGKQGRLPPAPNVVWEFSDGWMALAFIGVGDGARMKVCVHGPG